MCTCRSEELLEIPATIEYYQPDSRPAPPDRGLSNPAQCQQPSTICKVKPTYKRKKGILHPVTRSATNIFRILCAFLFTETTPIYSRQESSFYLTSCNMVPQARSTVSFAQIPLRKKYSGHISLRMFRRRHEVWGHVADKREVEGSRSLSTIIIAPLEVVSEVAILYIPSTKGSEMSCISKIVNYSRMLKSQLRM